MNQWMYESPVGPIYLVASARGLSGALWRPGLAPFVARLADAPVLEETVRQLDAYFAGARTTFDLPLDVEGSVFQKRVWGELARIPFGQTVSYREIARALDHERAVRAVGGANGRNPISIIVPCHRVISADGTLGGYAGGLAAKRGLLALEGIHFASGAVVSRSQYCVR